MPLIRKEELPPGWTADVEKESNEVTDHLLNGEYRGPQVAEREKSVDGRSEGWDIEEQDGGRQMTVLQTLTAIGTLVLALPAVVGS